MAFVFHGVRPVFCVTLLVVCLLLIPATAVRAQSTYTAQLSGVVSDSSGAVIPGARVLLTDESTGVSSSSTTDGRGIYVFTGVRPAIYSMATDDSSIGFNAFVGNLNLGNPQQLDRLRWEYAISANDAPQRFVLAAIVDLPFGRGRWIGRDMNRVVDAVIGGWTVSTIITLQSGQPLPITMAVPRLADGNQRPNVTCSTVSSGISYHQAAATGASLFNSNCFADPGDQMPGNAPRYFSDLRGDGIHNADLSFIKEFSIKENMKLQFRREFFNFTNTPRFAFPDLAYGSATFGEVTSTAPGSTPRHTQFGLRFQF